MLFSSRAQSGQIETELILDRSGDGGIIIEHHRNTYDVAPGAAFSEMPCVETHLISLRVISLCATTKGAHVRSAAIVCHKSPSGDLLKINS
jgi:hypothetical protein